MNKEVLFEAVKEPLRILALAVIPLLLAYFTELSYGWAGIIVLFLRLLDSYLHNLGKEVKSDILSGGLTRF